MMDDVGGDGNGVGDNCNGYGRDDISYSLMERIRAY